MEDIWPIAKALADTASAYAAGQDPRSEQTNVTLTDGARLTGTVGGIHGHVVLQVSYSRLHPRHRLAAWVRLLALSAAHPDVPFEAVTIGRGDQSNPIQIARIPQLGGTPAIRASAALEQLLQLTTLRAEGLRAPLPLPCETAYAYAEAVLRTGDDPVAAAMRKWRSGWTDYGFREREEDEPEHVLALGAELEIERLAELAITIWQPLLAREVVEG